jgi:membrane-bound lytic murein transglycosylase MltF
LPGAISRTPSSPDARRPARIARDSWGFFTLASYNAGPTRIRQLRREAERRGLDPNVWFGQVERIAAERIGRETVSYVSNIFKYYIAFRLVAEEEQRRAAEREKLKGRGEPGRPPPS